MDGYARVVPTFLFEVSSFFQKRSRLFLALFLAAQTLSQQLRALEQKISHQSDEDRNETRARKFFKKSSFRDIIDYEYVDPVLNISRV